MKKLLLFSSILLAAFFFSCSDDDDTQPSGGTSNTSANGSGNGAGNNGPDSLLIHGVKTGFDAGLIEDYGKAFGFTPPSTHYNYDFTITDGVLRLVTDSFGDYYQIDSAHNTIYVELFSADTTAFQSGTYIYKDFASITDPNGLPLVDSLRGINFFTFGNLNDGMGIHTMVGGTVTVTGSSLVDYAISYNVSLSDSRTITGTYNGNYTYSDQK